jgi:hypothetical protein
MWHIFPDKLMINLELWSLTKTNSKKKLYNQIRVTVAKRTVLTSTLQYTIDTVTRSLLPQICTKTFKGGPLPPN